MTPPNNMIGWFEIPVTNMERAMQFYETVFAIKMERHQMGPLDMGWFPWVAEGKGAGGALVKNENYKSSGTDGALVYFTAHSGDLQNELNRIETAGGKILMPKKLIKEDIGYMALFLDTEGNRIAIHSRI